MLKTIFPIQTTNTYLQDYELLKKIYDPQIPQQIIPDTSLEINNLAFQSASEKVFPSDKQYYAPRLGGSILNLNSNLFEGELDDIIQLSDANIQENKNFQAVLIKPQKPIKAKGLILLFHGLNEKDWTKYLPWAKKMVELSGKAVILFPLAFHIDRAYPTWHESRIMNAVSKKRLQLFAQIKESSFTNAAMSTRLHFSPVRFFYSGLETYFDVIQLVKEIKENKNPFIDKNASIDFFGYSAGAFLAQILLMANRDGMFDESKAVLFCGGPLLSRMHLSSRYIMDSEAYQAIYDFYVDDFDRHLQTDEQLNHLFEAANKGGMYFRSMLGESYSTANALRKKRFEELSKQMLAIGLQSDTVMPPSEIQASLLGTNGLPAIPTQWFDFAYPHSHMMPFPNLEKIQNDVNAGFESIFETSIDFLGKL